MKQEVKKYESIQAQELAAEKKKRGDGGVLMTAVEQQSAIDKNRQEGCRVHG